MTTYAVILEKPSESAWGKMKEKYPAHYILNPTAALVTPESAVMLTGQVAESLGIGEEDGIIGFVCEVAYKSGYYYQDLWEWLGKFDA